jgi:putative methionine-R-sulfoxide reductase with GAF domain
MNLISSPASFFNRLKYPQKFALITLLFVLPLLAFYPLVNLQNQRIQNYGVKEYYGVEYLLSLENLLRDAQQYNLAINSSSASQFDVNQAANLVENDFQELRQVDEKYGVDLQTSSSFTDLYAEWQSLKSSATSATISQQDRFITSIQSLISYVGDTSYLILDPDLDTYYMMDAVLLRLPESQRTLAQILVLGETIIKNQSQTADQRTQMIILTENFRSDLNTVRRDAQIAFENNPSGVMQKTSQVPLDQLLTTGDQFLSLIDLHILNSSTISLSLSEFISSANATLEKNDAFYKAASQSLAGGVAARRDSLQRELVISLATTTISAILAFTLGLFLMLSISRPLSALTDAVRQLSAGNMNVRVAATGEDEVSQVGLAFNEMVQELQSAQVSLDRRAAQLATVAEVSTATSTILETKRLLQEVVDLTKERFNLYHSHIYLLDEEARLLVLTAGAGEPGRVMVKEGRSIPLDREQSLVARAARERKGVTVNDVTQAPDHLPNPLLPDTRSELAVPMIAGGNVIGVFDIQSDQVGRFTESDVNIQTTLAAQLAVSIQNVRSFERSKREAELQSLVNVIGSRIQRTTSIEETLQTAIRELGTAIGAPRVKATIQPASSPTSTKPISVD